MPKLSAAEATDEWKKHQQSAKSRKYRTEVRFDKSWAERAWRVKAPNLKYDGKTGKPVEEVKVPSGFKSLQDAVIAYHKLKKVDFEKKDAGDKLDLLALTGNLALIQTHVKAARAEVKQLVHDKIEQKGMEKLLDEVLRLQTEEFSELAQLKAESDLDNAPVKPEAFSKIVWKGDLKKYVKPLVKDTSRLGFEITFKPIIVSMRLTDSMAKEFQDRGAAVRLYQGIEREMNAAAQSLAADFNKIMGSAGLVQTLNDRQWKTMESLLQEKVNKAFEHHTEDLRKALAALPRGLLNFLKLQNKFGKQYNTERGIAITRSSAVLVASVAATAAPGAAPLAMVGVVRGAAGFSQELMKFTDSLDKKVQTLKRDLNDLNKSYRGVNLEKAIAEYDKKGSNNRKTRRARELGGSFMNGVMGIDLIATVDTALAQLEDIEGDYHRSARAFTKKQVKLDKLLRVAEDAEKKWEQLIEQNRPLEFKAGADKKGVAAIKKLRDEVIKALKRSFEISEELNRVEQEFPVLRAQLNQLKLLNRDALNNTAKISKLIGGLSVSALGFADAASGAYSAVGELEVLLTNTVIGVASDAEGYSEAMWG